MDIKTWMTIGNGNCEGMIGFKLVAKCKDGVTRKQTFSASKIAVNNGSRDTAAMRLYCIERLIGNRLPYLMAELRMFVKGGKLVSDDDKKTYEFEPWDWYME